MDRFPGVKSQKLRVLVCYDRGKLDFRVKLHAMGSLIALLVENIDQVNVTCLGLERVSRTGGHTLPDETQIDPTRCRLCMHLYRGRIRNHSVQQGGKLLDPQSGGKAYPIGAGLVAPYQAP